MKLYLSSFRLGDHPELRAEKVEAEITWPELVETVWAMYQRTGVPHLAMRDGQALVIDGDRRELI